MTRIVRTVVALAAAAVVLALPASAVAAGENEPNDGIHLADGPMVPGTNYDGLISSTSDIDWWIVHVNAAGNLQVNLNNTVDPSEGCCSQYFELFDANGDRLNYRTVYEGETGNITYTTPGPGTYYVVVEAGKDDRYRLTADGPVANGSRPPAPEETVPNNNPTKETAFGPLVGNRLYGGSIDAVNETDWYVFYTSGPGTFDVEVTNVNDPTEGCCSVSAELYGGDGTTRINYTTIYEDTIRHLTYTGGGSDRYYLKVDAGSSDRYFFKVNEPGGLLTSTVPPKFTQACAGAEAKLAKVQQKLANAKAKKASAFTKKAKRKARAKVQKAKQKVKDAKAAVAAACGT